MPHFTRPAERRALTSPGSPSLSPSQKAAIEKELSKYLVLTCGHKVTKEVALLYAVFSPIDVYCETHGEFYPVIDKTPVETLPEDPMF